MSNDLKVSFDFEKDTKNTTRFKEHLEGPMDTPVIGTLYVQKTALQIIGYKEGEGLTVTIAIK